MMTPSEQNPTYNQLNLTSNILGQFLFNKEQPCLTPSDLQGQLCCVRISFTLVLQDIVEGLESYVSVTHRLELQASRLLIRFKEAAFYLSLPPVNADPDSVCMWTKMLIFKC